MKREIILFVLVSLKGTGFFFSIFEKKVTLFDTFSVSGSSLGESISELAKQF